jgi:hypothetical protein
MGEVEHLLGVDPFLHQGALGDELRYLKSHGYEYDAVTMQASPKGAVN